MRFRTHLTFNLTFVFAKPYLSEHVILGCRLPGMMAVTRSLSMYWDVTGWLCREWDTWWCCPWRWSRWAGDKSFFWVEEEWPTPQEWERLSAQGRKDDAASTFDGYLDGSSGAEAGTWSAACVRTLRFGRRIPRHGERIGRSQGPRARPRIWRRFRLWSAVSASARHLSNTRTPVPAKKYKLA